ncbi:hypothetical protein VT84_06990 [Gemmata sp. SH-PL17]|uniref:hypothetical protein n=1 Tax=Gemmata sp. SH-PL17 TaxID=1630693 RepID=UPI00078BF624|nr:hypothetical protein [Gemmata sp. SH-PL17]AMV24125.1 hypothetical protein VT84_06990 [Gemmata sp. SH-PL17]
MALKTDVLAQLDTLIETGKHLARTFRLCEMASYESTASEEELRAFVTSALAAIERITGTESQYFKNIPAKKVAEQIALAGFDKSFVPTVTGVLTSLRSDVDRGYLTTLEARLRANVHDDFMVQAHELLKASYHVAALVIAGGVLENHLRQMATTRNLTWTGSGSIAKYNDVLRDRAYAQPIWRRIQAVGDLRNHAAHGNGTVVSAGEAEDTVKFIARFIADNPT